MAEKKQDTFVNKYLPNFMDAFQKKAEISLQKSLEPSGKVCKFVGGRAEQKWIPVTERLPEEMEKVLAYTDVGSFAEVAYWTGYRWEKTWDFEVLYGVTHWMPLPEPPKEVE